MNYKIEGALKKSRITIIVAIILWFLMAIVFIMPMTCAKYTTTLLGYFDSGKFGDVFGKIAGSPILGFKTLIKYNLILEYIKNIFGFSLLYIAVVVIGFIRMMPKHRYDDIEHGSSDWSEHGEQYQVLSKKSGIILAENNYLPLNKRGNVNVLVVGGSGSGKSASYSIPNAHQLLGSYVFTDPKGELYDKTAGYLKQNGYKIKVLNLVHPQYSDGYNPLMHVASEIDVDIIANTIVKGQKTEGGNADPFWDDSAEMLLKALIYYLMATRPDEEQNLASCAELVRAANSNGGSNLLTELMSQLPYDHPARMNYKSIEIAPEKTYSSILSTLQSKLGKFDSKEIAELTSTDTIDFEQIGNEKTAVYVISSDTHGAYDFLLTIFFSQMIQQLYDLADNSPGLKLKIPTYFILDEFANIGRIPDFDKKISTSRSRAISFSVILQNLDQLEAIYEKANETIIGNCDTHVFLGSNSQKTVEYFSKALGEKTITRDNISKNFDKEHVKTGTGESDQIMGRALMTPDELRRMDNDLCIIFEKGIRPVKAKKFYYFKKPMAKELEKYEISHNDIGEIDRGVWRKYNPYNPYVPEEERKPADDLKIDSLDDLFADDEENLTNKNTTDSIDNKDLFSDIDNDNQHSPSIPIVKEDDAPILPMDEDIFNKQTMEDFNDEQKDDEYDLQKELEAKFDELFGPIDDNDNND
ncbi:MAG: type IV secretory system conjugative DNA transfer family protein [Clostridia bacterium]|nr:type IV secretory system conjugative DNA transfer family protein [Clostridia bacterium]